MTPHEVAVVATAALLLVAALVVVTNPKARPQEATVPKPFLTRTIDRAKESAKAVVALATPIATAFVTDVLLDLSQTSTGWVAVAATTLAVWLTPNKPKPTA